MTTIRNHQAGPPESAAILADLVARTTYKPGWTLELRELDREQGSQGLTLCISATVPDSLHPGTPQPGVTLNPYHRRALERIAAMPGGMLAYGAVAIAQDALHAAAYGDRGPCPHCAPLEHAGTSAGGYETSPGTPQTEGAHLAVEKTGAANAGAGSGNDERAAQLEREHAGGLPQLEREHRAP